MIVIADGGATKIAWCGLLTDGEKRTITTGPVHPLASTDADVAAVLDGVVKAMQAHGSEPETVSELHFYGSGVGAPSGRATVERWLSKAFPKAVVFVEGDLLGAARSLCGRKPGVVAILGTGSNAGWYDGTNLTIRTPSLGFLYADFGSAAALGKHVLNLYTRGALSSGVAYEVARYFMWAAKSASPPVEIPAVLTERQDPAILPTLEIRDAVASLAIELGYKRPNPARTVGGVVAAVAETHNADPTFIRALHAGFRDFFVALLPPEGAAETVGCTAELDERCGWYPELRTHGIYVAGSLATKQQVALQTVAAAFDVQVMRTSADVLEGLVSYHATPSSSPRL